MALHYGLSVPNFGDYASARLLAELARDAEAAGWDGFFLWDHVAFWVGGVPMVDPWIALAAIALSTERIRSGPLVTPLPRRRPVKLARETVSLDHLSNGRLTLGVGIGNGPWEWDQLGEETDLTVRGVMLDEGLEVLTGLWRGEPFSFNGTCYQVRETQFLPPPLQSPRIPIWVGGGWPAKAPFRRAARWDGVVPIRQNLEDWSPLTPGELRDIVAYVRAHRTTDAPFDVVLGGSTSGDNRGQAVGIVAPFAEAGLTWWIENVNPMRGELDEMRRRIRQGPPRG